MVPLFLTFLTFVPTPLLSTALGAPAGQNTLALGTVSGASGTDVVVPLSLANQDLVSGIQVEILFDPTVVAFTTEALTARSTGMSIGSSLPAAGRLRLLMYFQGGGSIAAGTGAVANLTFHIAGAAGTFSNLTPSAPVLSDPQAAGLSVTTTAGRINVSGGASGDSLTVGTGSGNTGTHVSVPLNLRNLQAVKALQFDIAFTGSVVAWVSGAVTARAPGMAFSAQPQAGDTVRVVMYYPDATTVTPGSGAVANLDFLLSGAAGTSSPLTLSGVIVSDPAGQPITVSTAGGNIDVTGGGNSTGACCAPGGGCSVTTQAACAAPSTWQGAGTVCAPSPCTQPTGACCAPGGGCSVTVQDACASPSTWQGAGTVCAPNPCTQSTGACCAPGGGCSVTTQAACAAPSTWQGAGTVCAPNPCTQPTGACCATDGTCTTTTQAACAAPSTWQGAATVCAPNPCPAPQPPDTLGIGSAGGVSGATVTIPISLFNRSKVRGIQLDIQMDPAVAAFVSGTTAPRVGTMTINTSSPSAGVARVLMYYSTPDTLAAGRGTVANLVFRLSGSAGGHSSLMPANIVIADAHGQAVPAVGIAGQVTVVGGTAQPVLHLAVLKNPGRPRTMQIFVSSDVALDAVPVVTLTGSVTVPMVQVAGVNLYQGSYSVAEGTAGVTVQASGNHDGAAGTDQVTVTF